MPFGPFDEISSQLVFVFFGNAALDPTAQHIYVSSLIAQVVGVMTQPSNSLALRRTESAENDKTCSLGNHLQAFRVAHLLEGGLDESTPMYRHNAGRCHVLAVDSSGEVTVTGTITAAGVVGPTAQNITVGDFARVVAALASNTAYGNIHTKQFPAGEIRGQIHAERRHHDNDDKDKDDDNH